uniref:Brefeldin A-inhibited guanine nucleotide-exchange protein 3 n=1 Tax=Lygus hesperus TaxID=30085 RepID=A0A0A9W5U0_LYGHE
MLEISDEVHTETDYGVSAQDLDETTMDNTIRYAIETEIDNGEYPILIVGEDEYTAFKYPPTTWIQRFKPQHLHQQIYIGGVFLRPYNMNPEYEFENLNLEHFFACMMVSLREEVS